MSNHEIDRILEYYSPLRKVKNYIAEHYSETICLRKISCIAGLEEKYFSSYFRKKTGMCFRDWLARERISRAKEMMRHRHYLITSVAFAVGFCELRTFERAFKKHTGTTPRDFKKSLEPD